MKTSLAILGLFCSINTVINAQLVATVQMKEPVDGICNPDEVYALFDGFEGQIRPKCTVSKKQMQDILNQKIQFLKGNPKFKGKGMVGVYINCEGLVVKWRISNKTSSEVLDAELLEIFKTFDDWSVGTFYGKEVDASELISYEIKKGVLIIN